MVWPINGHATYYCKKKRTKHRHEKINSIILIGTAKFLQKTYLKKFIKPKQEAINDVSISKIIEVTKNNEAEPKETYHIF